MATVLIVAHRLSTIRNAEHLIVLKGGRVIDQGRPEALTHDDRYYAAMLAESADADATTAIA